MAHLAATMQCLGVGEICQGCERDMERGEQWNAVEAEDGEPLGWHCDGCIANWKAGSKIEMQPADATGIAALIFSGALTPNV